MLLPSAKKSIIPLLSYFLHFDEIQYGNCLCYANRVVGCDLPVGTVNSVWVLINQIEAKQWSTSVTSRRRFLRETWIKITGRPRNKKDNERELWFICMEMRPGSSNRRNAKIICLLESADKHLNVTCAVAIRKVIQWYIPTFVFKLKTFEILQNTYLIKASLHTSIQPTYI